jgi:hypothetical protein
MRRSSATRRLRRGLALATGALLALAQLATTALASGDGWT